MRPVRLVEREGVEVDVQGLNVDRPMRSIGDTVHAKQRAPFMHRVRDFPDRVDGAQDVRGVRYGDEFGAWAQERLEVLDA